MGHSPAEAVVGLGWEEGWVTEPAATAHATPPNHRPTPSPQWEGRVLSLGTSFWSQLALSRSLRIAQLPSSLPASGHSFPSPSYWRHLLADMRVSLCPGASTGGLGSGWERAPTARMVQVPSGWARGAPDDIPIWAWHPFCLHHTTVSNPPHSRSQCAASVMGSDSPVRG